MGLNESGAIELIRVLSLCGISVIFLDLGPSDIFGLSICDSIYADGIKKLWVVEQIYRKRILQFGKHWQTKTIASNKSLAHSKDDQNLLELFAKVKDEHLVEIFHKLFLRKPVLISEIMYFLICDLETATAIYKKMQPKIPH